MQQTYEDIIEAAGKEYRYLMEWRNDLWKGEDKGTMDEMDGDNLLIILHEMRLLINLGLIDTKKIPDEELSRRSNEWENQKAEMSYAEGENDWNLMH